MVEGGWEDRGVVGRVGEIMGREGRVGEVEGW